MWSSVSTLVFGANGQIGQQFRNLIAGENSCFVTSQDLDLSQIDQIASFLDGKRPQIILNCAAYTAVDAAESDRENAELINHRAVEEMAKWCAKNDALLVHFSTDYVFEGTGEEPWSETAEVGPINFYGQSKLLGEQAILNSGARAFIFRTSWVYNENGKNFVNTMLRLGQDREELTVVDDQIGTPNYAYDLALATMKVIERQMEVDCAENYGVYHLSSAGYCSWYDFAGKIFELSPGPLAVKQLTRVNSDQFKTAARRPQNSRLSTNKLKNNFNVELPNWQDGLARCMERIYENRKV